MKKLLSLTLVILMLFTLAACGFLNTDGYANDHTLPQNNPPATSDSGDITDVPTKGNDGGIDQPDLSIEFLYAQMNGPYMGEHGPAIWSIDSGMLIFAGANPDEYQRPLASDFVFCKNGVPEESGRRRQLGEGRVVDLTAPHNERATVYPFIPDTYDTIIVYTYRMLDYSDEKGAEYWFEATVNGVKIRSNTLVWHTDGTYEYLDDMPQPSSEFKLKHLSQIPALTATDPYERGSSNANVNSSGDAYTVYKGDWIYYCINHTLYKMRADGTENQLLPYGNDIDVYRSFNVIGDWIITRSEMYKTDGTIMVPLPIEGLPAWPVLIVGDWIYYAHSMYTGDAGIYRVRIDGSERETLVTGGDEYLFFNIADDYIFYSMINKNSIFRVKTNGEGKQEIPVNDEFDNLIVDGEWMYYRIGGGISRMNVNTLDEVILVEATETADGWGTGWVGEFVTDGQWIYYRYFNRPPGTIETASLYKIRVDGTESVLLSDEYGLRLNITGDWLFYYTSGENSTLTWYMISTDGTDKRLITSYSNY
ncbi:MAG: DUF5050 domain-containing protein [Oscillospiraceae bacterium]|nr:DUF5050 domain-containing protein [Oscillospiraceae bacterium]